MDLLRSCDMERPGNEKWGQDSCETARDGSSKITVLCNHQDILDKDTKTVKYSIK